MSITSGRAKLEHAAKELRQHWDHTLQFWNDPVSHALEREHIVPLEQRIKAALPNLDEIAALLHRARRDCE